MPQVQLPLEIRLREDATFANYLGEAPRRLDGADPLVVVHGEEGSGKSHLLQAVCHDARGRALHAFYLDSPAQHDPGIAEGLEGFDIVCIDDAGELFGRDDWEVALFHLINGARDAHRRLVIAVDRPPRDLDVRLPDLRSRLLAALPVETDTLGDDEKLQLLKDKANRQGFGLPDEVGRFILSRADRSPRALVDLLERIELATLAEQRRVTIPLVKSVLAG